jgi:nucleotide-binding universal stress UspA family protein
MLAMETILYPTDFSAESGPAFEVACALARDGGGRVVILHVERSPLATLGGFMVVPPLPDEYDRQRVQKQLHRIQPSQPGICYEHSLEYGEPAECILKTAQEIGADLIVMGTHGRTGLSRLLMGSVAEHVVRKAPCPVLTIRAAAETLPAIPADSAENVAN